MVVDLEAALGTTDTDLEQVSHLHEEMHSGKSGDCRTPPPTPIRAPGARSSPASTTTGTVKDSPNGYPRLARFIAASEEHYVFRQFRYLQSRVLLHLQDELRTLETRLWRMDEYDSEKRPKRLQSREADDDVSGERGRIISEIQEKLFKYGEFLSLSNQLACLERPPTFNQLSLENFFAREAPLVRHEQYIGNRSDMVALKAFRDDAWLDRKIFQLLVKLDSPPIQWVFSSRDTAIINQPGASSFSVQKVRLLKTAILIALMVLFFSVPLVPLYIWSKDPEQNGTVVAKMMGLQVSCALLFGVVLAACTRARKHEILTACAGYVAILVVFMGQN